MSHAVEARRMLRHCRSGALATLSARLSGHPFASVVPFMTDYDATPILLISRLAEHTKNVAFDPRVSLMVHEPNADVQAAARLTIVGTCARIDAPASLRDRYVRLFPDATELLTLDFDFHRIVPVAIRYIGGFGKIHWLSTETFCDAVSIDASVEERWMDRLNDESVRTAKNLGRAVALDCDGVDFSRGDCVRRIMFTESVPALTALPAAIDDLLQRAIA